MNSFGNPADSLSHEHEAVRLLTQLLQQEQEYLIAADIDGIANLTEPKAKAAARMAELAAWRHSALAAAGCEASEDGMQSWLATSGVSKTTSQSWHELIELAKVAKEINRVNGTLIGKQMVRNQNLLNILQHGSAQGDNVYGPNGQTAGKSAGRHIIA
jgi:flagellar biosynthesis protein FlgN